MPTLAQVEEQILVCEGFRVTLTLLKPKTKLLPSYDYRVMAPQKWRISDWKNARLSAYLTLVRAVAVHGGDGSEIKRDLQLGHVRDSYYLAAYGSIAPPVT